MKTGFTQNIETKSDVIIKRVNKSQQKKEESLGLLKK
jgi:hypothetical protein